MNRVLEVDYDNQIAVVEPGLVNLHLSWAVGPQGFYYAPDPSSQQACTIGGNIANNSGGPHTLKYGVTTNHVLGLEVVLPDGELVWLGGKTRDAQGYDLVGLFVGSEGTFGIATKIVVRILKKPQAVKTVLAVFDQVDQASEAVSAIIARGLVPAAMEMIDQLTIQAVEDAFGCGYPRDAAAALLIELDGLAAGMDAQAERVVQACRDCGARDVRAARDEAERALLWKGRKSAFGAYGRISPAYMVMDGVIPRTKLPYVLGRVNAIAAAHGLRVGNVFHAGDGNLHPNILYDPRKPGEEARVVAAGAEILKVCAEVGGSISGEHGIGLEKADYMPFIFSEADLACMQPGEGRVQPHAASAIRARSSRRNKACVEVGSGLPSASDRREGARAAVLAGPPETRGARRLARPAAPHRRRAPRADRRGVLALRRRRPRARGGGRSRARQRGSRGGGDAGRASRGCRSPRGAAAPRCASARRRAGSASCWPQAARPHPRARAGRSHRHRRGRASRSTGCRPSWASGASGCRSIRPRPTARRSAASSPATPRGRAGTSTARRATW